MEIWSLDLQEIAINAFKEKKEKFDELTLELKLTKDSLENSNSDSGRKEQFNALASFRAQENEAKANEIKQIIGLL